MVYVQCRIKTWVLVASAQGPRSELQVWSSVVPSARWTTPGAASVVHRRRPEATRTLCCETLFVPPSALVGIKKRMQVITRLCVCVVSEYCMGSKVWGRGASSRFFEKKCATGPHITSSPWSYSSRAPCPGYSDLIRLVTWRSKYMKEMFVSRTVRYCLSVRVLDTTAWAQHTIPMVWQLAMVVPKWKKKHRAFTSA